MLQLICIDSVFILKLGYCIFYCTQQYLHVRLYMYIMPKSRSPTSFSFFFSSSDVLSCPLDCTFETVTSDLLCWSIHQSNSSDV